jgi:hypothetical protein
MTNGSLVTRCAGVLFVLGAAVSASAAPVTFSFNSLSSGATASQIATYMDGVVGCASCVTVTGAVADQTYTGDGFTVGPGSGGSYTSLTLGNTNGATSNSSTGLNTSHDTFIANTNDSSSTISSEFDISFTGGYSLSGTVGFDFEIFPDGTGQTPDFTFDALSGATLVATHYQAGVVPGTTDGSATHSPNSGSGAETNLQYIGTWTTAPLTNVTELEFIDWPATIGIDNLSFSNDLVRTTSAVPEPASLFLLGTGLLAVSRKRFFKKA